MAGAALTVGDHRLAGLSDRHAGRERGAATTGDVTKPSTFRSPTLRAHVVIVDAQCLRCH